MSKSLDDFFSGLSKANAEELQQNVIEEIINKKAREMTDEIVIISENVIKKINQTGWTLPIEMAIYPFKVLGATSEIRDIDKFFNEYFTHNENYHLKGLIRNILGSEIDEKFKRGIEECVYAYENEKYIIASITLLTIVEGVLSGFETNKKNTRMMKVCQMQADKTVESEDIIEKYSWISYNNFIKKLYEPSDFGATEPSFINRHWILHGRTEYNLTNLDCLRLFNALSTICYIVDMEDGDGCPLQKI